MKSIVEEASSIVKAVEKAWIRAEKPASFQIKVLEEPCRNFFGLTVRSAKISFFYTPESEVRKKGYKRTGRSERRSSERRPRSAQSPRETTRETTRRDNKKVVKKEVVRAVKPPVKKEEVVKQVKPEVEKKPRIRWNQEMIDDASAWLKNSLASMGKKGVPFTVDARGYYLRFTFDNPVLEDKEKEQQLFRSFAHLIMQMFRSKHKKGLIGYKVVLKSQ